MHIRVCALVVALATVHDASAAPRRKKPREPAVEAPAAPAPPTPAPRSAPAVPGIESELIREGLQAYDDLDYPRAIELFQKALKETLTRNETIATHKALGFCHAAINDMNAARADFEAVLRIDRTFDLDRTVAPRVRAIFEEAKNRVAGGTSSYDAQLPQLSPAVRPPAPKEGEAVTIAVDSDNAAARKLVVHHRITTQDVFARVDSPNDGHGRFAAMVPAGAVKPPGLEYYLELVDDNNVAVARAGSFGLPIVLGVQPKKRPRYWVIGVVGGLLAVGAVATGVTLGTRNTIAPNAPANVTLQPF